MKDMGKIKPNTDPTGENGYPEKDVNKGVTHMKMRGAGAATKGTKFVSQINLKNGRKFSAGYS
jgi:hypothetical protein